MIEYVTADRFNEHDLIVVLPAGSPEQAIAAVEKNLKRAYAYVDAERIHVSIGKDDHLRVSVRAGNESEVSTRISEVLRKRNWEK